MPNIFGDFGILKKNKNAKYSKWHWWHTKKGLERKRAMAKNEKTIEIQNWRLRMTDFVSKKTDFKQFCLLVIKIDQPDSTEPILSKPDPIDRTRPKLTH